MGPALLLWPLWILACGGGGPPQGAEALPDLEGPSGSRSIALRTRPGRYQFDAPTLPGLSDLGDDFTLEVEEVPNPKGVPRKQKVLRARLPFTVPAGRFAPPGLSVSIAGQPLAFARGKVAQAERPSWRINGKYLILAYPELPEAGTTIAHWPGLRAKLERRDPSLGTLEPDSFARYDVTLAGETRHGILLPAPASVEWDLQLPEGTTRFETWTALERAPLSEPAPDPVTVALSVIEGGARTELGSRVLKRDTEAFELWSADLSPWAGKAVTLRAESQPGANPWFDWAFLGAPTIRVEAEGPVRHVVVLAMDTTRPDHLGFNGYTGGATPELDAIGRQSIAFDRTWSVAPRTRPSFRSATTGRLPLDAVGQTNIAEVFQREGFATAGIVANVHLQPRFDFDNGFDWWHYDNAADADAQVDRALAWMAENADRDTFLFLHFMDPHMPYRAPGAYREMFVTNPDPTLPQRYDRFLVNRWSKSGSISEQRKAHITALHDGEMAWMSAQIGRFFHGLDAIGGRSLAVIHTDHGEEFWDHGGFEHNHTLYDETTRTVLWLRPGGGLAQGRRLDAPASLMDIAPTLFDLLGFDDRPETDGVSLAPALRGSGPVPERALPVGYLQYDIERWGVVFGDHKYILHTASGRQELYDLAADPHEATDLAGTTDLSPYWDALARAHEVEVRPGLRLFVDLSPGSEPISVHLPRAVLGAGVLDPEVALAHRANQEWGEPPLRRASAVGEVSLSGDQTGFQFTPGTEGDGVLWVQAQAPISESELRIERAGEPLQLVPSADGARWGRGRESIRVAAGPVLVPPPGEAARMGLTANSDAISEEELRKLCELGYIEPCPVEMP